MSQKTGIELIAQERQEQITKHGVSVENDFGNNNEFQLTDAVSVMVSSVPDAVKDAWLQSHGEFPPIGWSHEIWNKMIRKSYRERLIIAGALIAAEIDRIDYATTKAGKTSFEETLI